MTRLLIHIGSPKTGTTAIQQFMNAHREALRDQGVLYPLGGLSGNAHHLIGAAVQPKRRNKLPKGSRDDVLETASAEIRREAAEYQSQTVVLSSEYLWGETPEDAARRLVTQFPDWQVGIIAYLRRQDLLAQSLYVQIVKTGYPHSFAHWLAENGDNPMAGFDLDRVLGGWQAAGARTVIARVYEAGQVDADITVDFLRTVAPGVTITPGKGKRSANTAPGRSTVELLRRLNERVDNDPIVEKLRRRIIAHAPQRRRFEPLSYFAHGEAERFLDRFAAGNAAVARRYLGRDDGRLFLEPPATGSDADGVVADKDLLDELVSLLPRLASEWPIAKKS